MVSFPRGSHVNVRGRTGVFIVREGRPDSDNEIKVYDVAESSNGDWSYVHTSHVSFAEPLAGAAVPQAVPLKVRGAAAPQPTNSNQEGNTIMANVARSIVKVVLIDADAGLDAAKALVKDFGQHVLEGSQEDLKMEIVMGNNMESILRAHNEMRAKELDLAIRSQSGQEVKLLPRKLGELTWKIGTVA